MSRRLVCTILLTSALAAIPIAQAGDAKKDLIRQLQTLDLKKSLKDSLPENSEKSWFKEQRSRRETVNQDDLKAWREVKTLADWEAFKTPRIKALADSLGHFPEKPKSVPVHVTRKIAGDGFLVENLVFESRPGLWVTANLYLPEKAAKAMPGILIIASHHNPKSQSELRDMGVLWARKGCLVLIPDQLGHGECRQHPFTDAGKYAGEFRVGRQDYYFRYNVAQQLHLVGESLMGWMVWDTMRGVDVLLAKPGINEDAIVLLGSVAGGGDPAAVTAALDPRIKAVVPFNFGGPQPETKYPLPVDAETTFNYMGSGYWESTRNLRLSGRDGFLPWLIVASAAPRGLAYAHEFSWDQKRDPVWARLQRIYALHEADLKLAFTHGRGVLSGKPPEATHSNNIGPEHREKIHAALAEWFDLPEGAEKTKHNLTAADLTCWTEELKDKLKPKMVWELAEEIANERLAAARKKRERKGADQLRTELKALLGMPKKRDVVSDWSLHREPIRFESASQIDGMGFRLFFPPAEAKKYPVVIALAQEGPQAFLKQRAEHIAELLDRGIGVCLVELRGMGLPSKERGRSSAGTSLSATELMLGNTVIGTQLRDLQELVSEIRGWATQLRGAKDLDPDRIALWADSFAPVNAMDADLVVPLDAAKMPYHAEPGSGLVALLAAVFDPRIKAVYVRGGLASYESILESPFLYLPHDAIVPGLLGVADCADLASAIAPRALRIEALVDGRNLPASNKQAAAAFKMARARYAEAGATERFAVDEAASRPDHFAKWFAAQLPR